MKIGIKYCGGCNPVYDRIGAVDKLKKRLAQHVFLPYSDEESFDAVLIVSGCASRCASVDTPVHKVYLADIDDIDAVVDSINKITKWG